jgi:regulator of nucleoside diphosphate kinase
MERPEIVITSVDFERLQNVLDAHPFERDQRAIDYLDAELSRARVVPPWEIAANVVTMNSRFRYAEQATGESRTVTLVYPSKADMGRGWLSVLAPVGCALLGLTVGQRIEWPLPNGTLRSFGISEILFQPEAAGEYAF